MSKGRRGDFSEINITPLTDIFLVLLIIMMVIAPMLDSQGLKLAVPTVGAAEGNTQPKTLSLQIAANGAMTLNGQGIAKEQLQAQFFQQKANFPDGLLIETDPQTHHGALVFAMDAGRAAGIEKMAVTEAGGGAP